MFLLVEIISITSQGQVYGTVLYRTTSRRLQLCGCKRKWERHWAALRVRWYLTPSWNNGWPRTWALLKARLLILVMSSECSSSPAYLYDI